MPYQTVTSPCYSCLYKNCQGCNHVAYANIDLMQSGFSPEKDRFMENLWRECVDIAWAENENGEIILDQQWRGFPVGEFTQDDWFYWVDENHSKGICWVYENISPYDFENGTK